MIWVIYLHIFEYRYLNIYEKKRRKNANLQLFEWNIDCVILKKQTIYFMFIAFFFSQFS